jgi:hypothetical protein
LENSSGSRLVHNDFRRTENLIPRRQTAWTDYLSPLLKASHHRPWVTASWVLAGTLSGAAFASAGILPDFLQRVRLAFQRGGGESADWGEPLFYLVVLGVPAGLIAGTITFALILFGRWFRRG